MPDVGSGVIEILDEELRYLQRKKLVKELDSVRMKVSFIKQKNATKLIVRMSDSMENWPNSKSLSHLPSYTS
jgi:hypothetical protein